MPQPSTDRSIQYQIAHLTSQDLMRYLTSLPRSTVLSRVSGGSCSSASCTWSSPSWKLRMCCAVSGRGSYCTVWSGSSEYCFMYCQWLSSARALLLGWKVPLPPWPAWR